MIIVHHLGSSRSQRILWLLEELGLPYRLERYERDPVTKLAPPALEAIHPLGKAPLIEDDGLVIHESGAVIDYIIRRHGNGQLAPDPASTDYDAYQVWLHYGEGSAMLPLMLNLYVTTRGAETPAIRARIDDELQRHLGYIDRAVTGRDYLVGKSLTGADIQVGFVAEMAGMLPASERWPALAAWVDRLRARPAYRRAMAAGGANAFLTQPLQPATESISA